MSTEFIVFFEDNAALHPPGGPPKTVEKTTKFIIVKPSQKAAP